MQRDLKTSKLQDLKCFWIHEKLTQPPWGILVYFLIECLWIKWPFSKIDPFPLRHSVHQWQPWFKMFLNTWKTYPTPMRYLGLLFIRMSVDKVTIFQNWSFSSPPLSPPMAKPGTSRLIISEKWCEHYYPARTGNSPEPDLWKAVVSGFVRTLSVVCPKFVRACTEKLLRDFDEVLYTVYWYGLVVPPTVWRELVPPPSWFFEVCKKIGLCLELLHDYVFMYT